LLLLGQFLDFVAEQLDCLLAFEQLVICRRLCREENACKNQKTQL
jgi:hypothetical protein